MFANKSQELVWVGKYPQLPEYDLNRAFLLIVPPHANLVTISDISKLFGGFHKNYITNKGCNKQQSSSTAESIA